MPVVTALRQARNRLLVFPTVSRTVVVIGCDGGIEVVVVVVQEVYK